MSSIIMVPVDVLGKTVEAKLKVYSLEGEPVEEVNTPKIFHIPVRKDLIKRAYLSALTARIQPQGRDPMAGKRTTAESLGVGYGIARVPREKGRLRARFAASTVGGRRPHAPTVEKKIHEEINKKERKLAIASGIAATAMKELVKARGHRVDNVPQIPMIVVDEFVKINKTGEVKKVLKKLGLWDDIVRAQEGTKIRAGKGKMRGRRYYTPKSLLVVVHEEGEVIKAVRNLPGVEVVTPQHLSILHLAPGANPGRLTLYTKTALKMLDERFKVITI